MLSCLDIFAPIQLVSKICPNIWAKLRTLLLAKSIISAALFEFTERLYSLHQFLINLKASCIKFQTILLNLSAPKEDSVIVFKCNCLEIDIAPKYFSFMQQSHNGFNIFNRILTKLLGEYKL